MRVHRIIGVVGLGGLWLLVGGCGQESPPPKPSAPVVKKAPKPGEPGVEKAPEPGEGTAAQKPAEEKKAAKPVKVTVAPKTPVKGEEVAAAKPAAGQRPKKIVKRPPTARKPSEAQASEPAGTSEGEEEGEAYVYEPRGRPDPFRPFFVEVRGAEPLPECRDMPVGPLTEQEANQFTIVAVVSRKGESMAMVQDEQGKGYVLRLGTYVGKKCGRVASIGPDGVIVEEPYKDLLGQRQTRKVSLEFTRTERGGQ